MLNIANSRFRAVMLTTTAVLVPVLRDVPGVFGPVHRLTGPLDFDRELGEHFVDSVEELRRILDFFVWNDLDAFMRRNN